VGQQLQQAQQTQAAAVFVSLVSVSPSAHLRSDRASNENAYTRNSSEHIIVVCYILNKLAPVACFKQLW
jgi:hypothetical protein